jgi:hypothetical protein
MVTKIGFALVVLALVGASWTYRSAMADALAPLPTSKQSACNQDNCIGSLSHCRTEVISGWNDSLYAAAKAPGLEVRSCAHRSDLAMGE